VNDADAATYVLADPQPGTGASVANYYTEDPNNAGEFIPCAPDDKAVNGTTYYYKKEPALPNGNLATLTGKAALYTIPAGKTEAEVVDALALQDENATVAVAGTITGRSGLVLTPATKVDAATDIDAAGEYALTNAVEYGVDGNKIDVEVNQALRFKPAANTTYAFVYTKQAANPAEGTPIYQPVTKTVGAAVGDNVYRYDLKAAPTSPSTDVQKNVTYFAKNDGTEGAIKAFLGQNVSNLYLDNQGTQATGYAKTGTSYWYTDDNGLTFKEAAPILYASFKEATDLYTFDGTSYTEKTDESPVDGTAYYKKTTVGSVDSYTFCVVYPQQTNNLFVIDTDETKIKAATGNAVKGMIYLDKYTKNNGVYYTKIIKVQ